MWTDCQSWYRRRSPDLCPVLSCGAFEATKIDPASTAALPIELYSSARALLPNIVYHLASSVLLSCKPRLLAIPKVSSSHDAGFRRSISESAHIQAVLGIASNNDFNEQWDPILIAGLVYVGPKLTHRAQQKELLRCLGRAQVLTGLQLANEMEVLKDGWALT